MLGKVLQRLLLLSFIIAVLIPGLYFLGAVSNELINYTWINLIFYSLVALVVITIAYSGVSKEKMDGFLAALFGALFLKMAVCIGFFLVMRYAFDITPKTFFIPFSIFYIIFSIFETIQIFKINELAFKK